MIDKDELKAFTRFLREAKDHELTERAHLYREAIAVLDVGSDLRCDYRFLLRRVNDEQIARLRVTLLSVEAKKRQEERRRTGTF